MIDTKNYFNKNNTEPQIKQILENIYLCAKNNPLDTYILKTIRTIINIIEEKCAAHSDAFSDLFRDQLQKIHMGYDFAKALAIFEGIGTLIHFTAKANQ